MPDMFERTLVAALATMPAPGGSAALDARIVRAIGAVSARRPRWRPLPSVRRRAAIVGLVAIVAAASFAFRLPNQGGARWSGSVADTASGIRARRTDLVISPTRVRGELVFDGAIPDAGGQTWDSVGMELIHGDTRLSKGISLGHGGIARFDSPGGTDDAAGAWTVRIDALQRLTPRSGTGRDGHSPEPAVRTIQGPWVFHVTLRP